MHSDSEITEFLFDRLEENQTVNFASVLASIADDFLFWLCNEIEHDYDLFIDYELIYAFESGIVAEFKRSEMATLKEKIKANFPYSEVSDPIENFIKTKWDGENVYINYLECQGYEYITYLLDRETANNRNEELENWELGSDDRDPSIIY